MQMLKQEIKNKKLKIKKLQVESQRSEDQRGLKSKFGGFRPVGSKPELKDK